jgi:translation initiation factor 2 subunit 2
MDEYEKLLSQAYDQVKQSSGNGERFEIPKVEGRFEGKKTVITNFTQITTHLRRTPEHLQKFLSKELAAQVIQDKDRLVLNKKISSSKINPKIEQYTKEFVLCKECGKPDTEILKEDRINVLHCLACGAKHPIRGKI